MSDLIDKQVVLDTIHRFFTEEVDKIPTKKTEDGEVIIICKAQPLFAMNKTLSRRIKELPPVNQQEPKTGHWEWVQYDYNPKLGNWHCSECRCIVVECVGKEDKGGIPLYKYCPQCGIKMMPQESDHKCHTCKHYTSGEHDGSCGSYICKEYSNWESEE